MPPPEVSTAASRFDAVQVPLDRILEMREEYRSELNCQIVHDSWHVRGFTRSFLLHVEDLAVGYASVGGAPGDPQDIVKEFFVRLVHRSAARPLFRALVARSGARRIDAQTNDVLLTLRLFDAGEAIESPTILFAAAVTTTLPNPGAAFRRLTDDDRRRVFAHTVEPVGDWGLESGGAVVATGGIAFHYNPPYGDIFMEVSPLHRRKGLGSYLVQELKRTCREGGRVPAARCGVMNAASRRTLERAGLLPCARILRARIAVR